MTKKTEYERWKKMSPKLFTNRVGKYNGSEIRLHIDVTIPPRQDKLRPVPFNLRPGVERAIVKMLVDDMIEPVQGATPWISPIVPVAKKNGLNEIRICVDA